MKVVHAVKKDEVVLVHRLLISKFGQLYADIWKVGCNMGLRISDLLVLQYVDLDLINRSVSLIEKKTGKKQSIRLNSVVVEIVTRRRQEYPDDTWLFQVRCNRAKNKPVSARAVAKVFQDAGKLLNLRVGTHSMRKSRGMALFNDGIPIEKIAMVLNHSNPRETMRYLGITQEQVLQTYDDYIL